MEKRLNIIDNLSYDFIYKNHDKLYEFIKTNKLIARGKKVAVKLNLPGPFKPELAETTHPRVVHIIVDILTSLKCEVMVCEDIEDLSTLRETGVLPVLKQYKLPFYNLRKYGYKDIEVDGQTYQYSTLIDTCDVLIEIPKYKTHKLTKYNGSIQSMFSCIKKEQREEMHKIIDENDFANTLCSVYSIRKPDIIIMDTIIHSFGNPKFTGKLVLGTDGLLVDYCCTKATGFDMDQLKILQIAIRRNLSEIKTEEELNQYCPENVDSIFQS